jgi:hypothetical protein
MTWDEDMKRIDQPSTANVAAERNDGMCLANGSSVPLGTSFAPHSDQLAAHQGNHDAQYNSGACFAKRHGILIDESVAQYPQLAANRRFTGPSDIVLICWTPATWIRAFALTARHESTANAFSDDIQ